MLFRGNMLVFHIINKKKKKGTILLVPEKNNWVDSNNKHVANKAL